MVDNFVNCFNFTTYQRISVDLYFINALIFRFENMHIDGELPYGVGFSNNYTNIFFDYNAFSNYSIVAFFTYNFFVCINKKCKLFFKFYYSYLKCSFNVNIAINLSFVKYSSAVLYVPYSYNCSSYILNSEVVSLSSNPKVISNETLMTIAFENFIPYLSNSDCNFNWNDTNTYDTYECAFWDKYFISMKFI